MRPLSAQDATQVVSLVCNMDELDEPVVDYLVGLLTNIPENSTDEELQDVSATITDWSHVEISPQQLRQACESVLSNPTCTKLKAQATATDHAAASNGRVAKLSSFPDSEKLNRRWQPHPRLKVEVSSGSTLCFSNLNVNAKEFVPFAPEYRQQPYEYISSSFANSEQENGLLEKQQVHETNSELLETNTEELLLPWEYPDNCTIDTHQEESTDVGCDADYAAAAVALLADQFPQYSQGQLSQLFLDEGYDVLRCSDVLYEIEQELNGQLSAACQEASFTDADFPALVTCTNQELSTVTSSSALEDTFATALRKHSTSALPACSTPTKSNKQSAKSTSQSTQHVPWVETGEAVSSQYSESRALARDLARLRNMHFMQATQAYLAGNRALAKELSAKGRKYNEEMKAAHCAASSSIFRLRNSSNVAPDFIDLHGLHVAEALDILQEELSKANRAGYHTDNRRPRKLRVCVGTGNHTKGAKSVARLPLAVEHQLQSQGFKFTYEMPGLILVTL